MFGETEEEVLGRNELVVEGSRDARCSLEDTHELRREVQLKGGRDGGIAARSFDHL